MIPVVNICLDRNGNEFVVINHCPNPQMGCAEEYGPLLRLSPQEMEQNGLATVLSSLAEYPHRRKSEKSELESLAKAEQEEFDREHKHVNVSLQKGAELWLGPMHFGKR